MSGLHLPLGITTDYTVQGDLRGGGRGEGRILRIEGDKTIPVVVGFPRRRWARNSFQVGPTAIRVVSNMSVASVASLDVALSQAGISSLIPCRARTSLADAVLPEPDLVPWRRGRPAAPAGGFGALSNGIFALVFTSRAMKLKA